MPPIMEDMSLDIMEEEDELENEEDELLENEEEFMEAAAASGKKRFALVGEKLERLARLQREL